MTGLMYNEGKGVSQNYKTAVKWFRLAAEQGNADAQNNLGLMYNSGKRQFLKSDGGKSNQTQDEGIPQNYKIAVKWFRLAAEQGHVRAQLTLGVMYENGQGVPRDYKTAAEWYTLAVEQGLVDAQVNLAGMYYQGQGIPRDYKTAAKLYRLAAEQGDADGQTGLGLMYEYGLGVPQNDEAAAKWYRFAAEQGNAYAQNNLKKLLKPWWKFW